ncbi:hypothetical protein SAMN04487962_1257 [Marinobacter segnicrescens]|uniref:Uncharacterized protein n=1 Tax=Marinobacter segnicrescens TaxID=430453 RepID=A0A1I0H9L2_9GAMM|nr:hypothetical protein [Marinobacter segnicrescens]SET79585.1 hypothetical protein SAMN04487962_1257 [Marinobacter segnicrescens]
MAQYKINHICERDQRRAEREALREERRKEYEAANGTMEKPESDKIADLVSEIKKSVEEAKGGCATHEELLYVIGAWAPELGQSVANQCLEHIFLYGTSELKPKGLF